MPDQPLLPWVVERSRAPRLRDRPACSEPGLCRRSGPGTRGRHWRRRCAALGDAFGGSSQWDSAEQTYVSADSGSSAPCRCGDLAHGRARGPVNPADRRNRLVSSGSARVEPERRAEVRAAIGRRPRLVRRRVRRRDRRLHALLRRRHRRDHRRVPQIRAQSSTTPTAASKDGGATNGRTTKTWLSSAGDHIAFGGEVWGWSEGLSRASARDYFRILRDRLAGDKLDSNDGFWQMQNSVPIWFRDGGATYAHESYLVAATPMRVGDGSRPPLTWLRRLPALRPGRPGMRLVGRLVRRWVRSPSSGSRPAPATTPSSSSGGNWPITTVGRTRFAQPSTSAPPTSTASASPGVRTASRLSRAAQTYTLSGSVCAGPDQQAGRRLHPARLPERTLRSGALRPKRSPMQTARVLVHACKPTVTCSRP